MSAAVTHVCDDCGAALAHSERLPGWWCVTCDGSESEALDSIDEEYVRRADEEHERRAIGCTCDEFGDYQCDAHGADVIAYQRAEHEQWLRRREYRRPEAERVHLRVVVDGRERAMRFEDDPLAALSLSMIAGDPLAKRAIVREFSLRWRPYDHDEVRAHLREPSGLP